LVATFKIIDEIRCAGWLTGPLRLWQGSLRLTGHRGSERLSLHYQHAPPALRKGSHYREVQTAHDLSVGGLIPDLVLHRPSRDACPWLLIEVKGGHRR